MWERQYVQSHLSRESGILQRAGFDFFTSLPDTRLNMRTELKDPQYWRFRAEEAMSIAENLLEKEELKDVLRRVTNDYERVAKYVEKRRAREQK